MKMIKLIAIINRIIKIFRIYKNESNAKKLMTSDTKKVQELMDKNENEF